MMPAASPSLTASYSTASTSLSSDGKRYLRRKDFQYKYGQRHHSYDSEKAPYPLSYDKRVLELCVLPFPLFAVAGILIPVTVNPSTID